MPNPWPRWRTSLSVSTKVPGSSSLSMRSRAVSFPRSCCLATAVSSPACSASASLSLSSWRRCSSGWIASSGMPSCVAIARSLRPGGPDSPTRKVTKGVENAASGQVKAYEGSNPRGMSLRTFLEDFRDLRYSVRDLMADQTEAEEAATNAIVTCASRFSRHSKRVVDDKLSFSATLMRAGEVDAANRLLSEVEREVRAEEVALIETVNEVKVAQSARRDRITRLRLARTLAAATLSAGILTVSAAGMAVAGFLQDRAEATSAAPSARALETNAVANAPRTTDSPKPKLRVKRIAGVKVMLTPEEFRQ